MKTADYWRARIRSTAETTENRAVFLVPILQDLETTQAHLMEARAVLAMQESHADTTRETLVEASRLLAAHKALLHDIDQQCLMPNADLDDRMATLLQAQLNIG